LQTDRTGKQTLTLRPPRKGETSDCTSHLREVQSDGTMTHDTARSKRTRQQIQHAINPNTSNKVPASNGADLYSEGLPQSVMQSTTEHADGNTTYDRITPDGHQGKEKLSVQQYYERVHRCCKT